MQIMNNKRIDVVANTIKACLVACKGDVTIQMLERDYEEQEGEPIPFKEFDCPSLLAFLNQLTNAVQIERKNGRIVLYPVTEKSNHIVDMVAHQKTNISHRRGFKKPFGGFCANRAYLSVNSSVLMEFLKLLDNSPEGLSFDSAIEFINQYCYPLEITRSELQSQLGAISHLVVIRRDKLFPANQVSQVKPRVIKKVSRINQVCQLSMRNNSQSSKSDVEPVKTPNHVKPICEIPPLKKMSIMDDKEQSEKKLMFYPAGFAHSKHPDDNRKPVEPKTEEQISRKIVEVHNPFKINDKSKFNDTPTNHENNLPDFEPTGSYNDVTKISTEIRLKKLINEFPDGIWCSDLPEIYHQVYKTRLIYPEKEFNSVLDFVSRIPNIFYCVKPMNSIDYKLFNAKNPLPNLHNKKGLTSYLEAFSHNLDFNHFNSILPSDVMGFGESVTHLDIDKFGKDTDYEEIQICHVISPSFFWIQMRKNSMKFKKFIDDMTNFYEKNKSRYKVSNDYLKEGFNVVCFYENKWNRGIIKEIVSDSQVTIFLYDYGVEKDIFCNEVYFLHRLFSYLPAQAIPCGLYNVKPYRASNWTKQSIWEFISKTSIPLIATAENINLENYFILVNLTDTRSDIDIHINDWMCEENFGEMGHVYVKYDNFALSHYRECLKQKGYDPHSSQYIGSQKKNPPKKEEIKETPVTSNGSIEQEKSEYPPRIKRLMDSIAKKKPKEEEEKVSEDNLPPLKEIASCSETKSVESKEKIDYVKLMSMMRLKRKKFVDDFNAKDQDISTSSKTTDTVSIASTLNNESSLNNSVNEETDNSQKNGKELPPRIRRLLEFQSKLKKTED